MNKLTEQFGYHPATELTGPFHARVRELLLETATQIENLTPACREQQQAIECLRMAMFWANSAIAVHLAPLQEES